MPVRGGGGVGVLPQNLFVLHALRLILMQSVQRNVNEMKYTIANNTMNINSKPIKSSSNNVTKFHTARLASGKLINSELFPMLQTEETSTLWLTKQSRPTCGLATPMHVELRPLAS